MKKTDDPLEWIEKADHDLGTAKIIFIQNPQYYDTISFHCQQAVEKYLKAYLVKLKIKFKFTHDLEVILNSISSVELVDDVYYDMSDKLYSFGVQIRYPDDIINPTHEQLAEAISIAEKFREDFVSKILSTH